MFGNLFYGRYGLDRLSLFLLAVSLIFLSNIYTLLIGIISLAYAIYRTFSKNIDRRYQELQYFNRLTERVLKFIAPLYRVFLRGIWYLVNKFRTFASRYRQRKTHVFIKCPACKNTLRLPRGKGKLQVTCPVCRNVFYKKT